MKELLLGIRTRLNVSQEEMAKMIGTSFATVNRWENGHSRPNKAAQLRLYDICKGKGVDLEEMLQQKIKDTVADLKIEPGREVLSTARSPASKDRLRRSAENAATLAEAFIWGLSRTSP